MSVQISRTPVKRRPRVYVAALAVAALAIGLLAQGPTPAGAATSDVTADRLQVNASAEPLGLDDAKPTFSWILDTAQRGIYQDKYRIVVSTTKAKAEAGNGDVWNSGVVESGSTAVDYSGPALESRTRYYWSVKSWVPAETAWAEAGYFETAYLSADEWEGDWITGPARPIAPLTGTAGTLDDACCVVSNGSLAAAAQTGDTNIKLLSVAGLATGTRLAIGSGDARDDVVVTNVGEAAAPATTLAAPSLVGDQRIYVDSVTGYNAGRVIKVGTEQATIAAGGVGTAAGLAAESIEPAAAGATNIKVTRTTGFVVGQGILVGNQVRVVQSIGSPGASTQLARPVAAADTNIKLSSVANLVPGAVLTIGGTTNATVQTVGTAAVDTQLAADTVTAATAPPIPSYVGANWIWNTPNSNSSAPAGTIYLRKTFTIANQAALDALQSAMLRVNVDDTHTSFINGVQVAASSGNNAWQTSQLANVKAQLRVGTNVLAISATNGGNNAAGLIAALELNGASTTRFVADASWRASGAGPVGWNQWDFDDSAWGFAAVAGAYPMAPWNTLSDPNAPNPSNIKVASVANFAVGQAVLIGQGAEAEERTVIAVGTAGAGGTGVTLGTPLAQVHLAGQAVAAPGSGVTLTAPVGSAFSAGASVTTPGTGIDITVALAQAVGAGSVVRPLGSGISLVAPLAQPHALNEPITSLGSGVDITPALTRAYAVGTSVVSSPKDVCRPVGNSSNSGQCKPIRPNFLLRTDFEVAPVSAHGAVVAARLYSAGLGWSEPRVNGELTQPGDHLNPGFTDYKDTVQYTTDDVTELIDQHATQPKTNVLASEIAAGRYDSESIPSNHRFEFAQWRNQEVLKADLWVTYADGTEQVVTTDDSWKVSIDGPTRYADFDNGETYDARVAIDGWDTPAYDADAWRSASPGTAPQGDVIAQLHERTSETEKLTGPFYSWNPAPGVKAVDVGRQIAGWATIKVWGAAPGQVIRTVYVERRNDNTAIDDPNVPGTGQDGALQFAGNLQQSYYVSDGTGTEANPEVFTPNWNFAGFQWVQIDGNNGAALPDTVHVEVASAQQIMTDLQEVGTFESDDALLNQIHTNVKNTIKGNWIAGYSSDTPTYEKDGWTGDAQIILPTVANMFNLQRSMSKSALDSKDSQLDDGSGQTGLLIPGSEGYGYCSKNAQGTYVPCGTTPSIATFKPSGAGATPIWDAFIFVTSYEGWQRYADVRPMTTAFGTLENYLDDWIQGGTPYESGPGGWFTRDGSNDWTLNSGLGDWAFVTGADGNVAEGTNLNVGGFQAASSTAFTAYLAKITAEMSDVLYAKTGDAQYQAAAAKYRTLFDNIREDFNARWWDSARGFYAENATQELRQGFQAWAIGFGLVEEQNKLALMEKLAYDVAVTRTGHAMTGFVGIRWIWPVLSDAAHLGVPHAKDALFKVAQQTTYPSYGRNIGLGYTGIGEYWESSTRTRNHQFQGSIGQWFYEELAGIKPTSPGYKEFQVRPLVGSEYNVNEVSASVDTIHGKVSSSWVDGGADGELTLKVTVPANTTAKIHVPGADASKIVESGTGENYLAEDAPGVKLVGPVDDSIVYEVGSGTYEFTRLLNVPTLTAVVAAKCVGKKVQVQVTATNADTALLSFKTETAYGSKSKKDVAVGDPMFQTFNSNLATVPAGKVKLTVTDSATGLTVIQLEPYAALTCR